MCWHSVNAGNAQESIVWVQRQLVKQTCRRLIGFCSPLVLGFHSASNPTTCTFCSNSWHLQALRALIKPNVASQPLKAHRPCRPLLPNNFAVLDDASCYVYTLLKHHGRMLLLHSLCCGQRTPNLTGVVEYSSFRSTPGFRSD